jgi:hypothetical protein
LEEGTTQLPDRVLDAVLDELPMTRQRRGRWRFPGLPAIHGSVRIGLTAAAILISVWFLGLWAPNIGVPVPSVPPATATPAPAHDGAEGPGSYLVTDVDGVAVTLTVPEGWTGFDGWGFFGPGGEFPPDGVGIGFWEVGNLYADPMEPELMNPAIGVTVDDLVAGLARQPGHTTSEPAEVAVDGFAGKMIELTVPADAEFDECFGGPDNYRLWQSVIPGHYRCLQGPGQINRIWILDVDGVRLVIDAQHFPGTTVEDLAALDAVIESIRIEPGRTP